MRIIRSASSFIPGGPLVVASLLLTFVTGGCAMRATEDVQAATDPVPEAVAPEVSEAPVAETPAAVAATESAAGAEAAVEPGTAVAEKPARVEQVYNRDDVLWIQQRLQELGYYDRAVDGTVGPGTREAVRAYQQDQSIRVDGKPTRELRDYMWRNGG